MSIAVYNELAEGAPVLVSVINDPEDLLRVQTQHWYRIPLAHAPSRIGADFLAFYQTGAFPPDERWAIRWLAPVRGYHLATRLELIPDEPDHPRAHERYHQVMLGDLALLPHPVPSQRLRRITFIRTTLGRLLEAREINDLWIRTPAQERLWQALQEAGLADQVEHEYRLVDDLPYTADFAVFSESERVALLVVDSQKDLDDCIRERVGLDYSLARGGWRAIFVDASDFGSVMSCLTALQALRYNPSSTRQEI